TALNQGMINYPSVILFACRDHQLVQTTANRIIEFINGKIVDKMTTYDEYLASDEMAMKRQVYTLSEAAEEEKNTEE
ncbi:MAG: ABC transporter ATP-binding protein, partial [Lachnospiraceae bacterium]|nr:ABC transporter ATP-binding protein [Lachnospiraceae bacterium]